MYAWRTFIPKYDSVQWVPVDFINPKFPKRKTVFPCCKSSSKMPMVQRFYRQFFFFFLFWILSHCITFNSSDPFYLMYGCRPTMLKYDSARLVFVLWLIWKSWLPVDFICSKFPKRKIVRVVSLPVVCLRSRDSTAIFFKYF